MNKGQFFRTFKTGLLTGLHHIPAILLYTIIFLATAGIMIYCNRSYLTRESSLGKVTIGYCIEEKSASNEMALNIVTGMDSFQETADLIEYDTRDAGIEALNSGEILCLIFVPTGFVDGLFGEGSDNTGMEVIIPESKTMEGHLINDLLQSSARILGTAQGAYFALHFTDKELGLSTADATFLEGALDARNLTYVLTRTEHFVYENYEVLSKFSIKEKLISSYLILILFLSVFVIAYIYKGQHPVMQLRMNSAGLTKTGCFIAESLSSAVMVYLICLISFITVLIFVPSVSKLVFITAIPIVLAAALTITFFVYLFKNPVLAGLFTLIFTVILMYLAGGLVPVEFLPSFLQKASVYNPFTYLIRYMLYMMWR